jgi:hypothetical protein
MTQVRLTVEIEVAPFGDATPEEIEDALGRTSTHNPMDEIEGHLWSELNEHGIDSMVTVVGFEIRS